LKKKFSTYRETIGSKPEQNTIGFYITTAKNAGWMSQFISQERNKTPSNGYLVEKKTPVLISRQALFLVVESCGFWQDSVLSIILSFL
jgi:hypothetical protein